MALVGGVFPYGMPELPVAVESRESQALQALNSSLSRPVAGSLLAQLLPPDVAQCLENLTHEKRNVVILALIRLQREEVRIFRTHVKGFWLIACWQNENKGKRGEEEGAVGSESAVQGPSMSYDVGGSGSTSAMYGGLGSNFGPVQGTPAAANLLQSLLM